MKARFWFLCPLLWLAQLCLAHQRPYPNASERWKTRGYGFVGASIGALVMGPGSVQFDAPILGVGMAVFGLALTCAGLLLMLIRKQGR